VTYYVTVTNTGDVALDVSINDPACNLAQPIVIQNLAAHATSAATLVCTRTLPCPLSAADSVNTVPVTGRVHQVPGEPVICDINGQGQPVTATSTCQSTLTCGPQICITKEIACVDSFDPTVCGAYSDTATGVAVGTDNLAHFCYRILVWNCGPVALNNVVVTDSVLGINYNVGSLPANQTAAQATTVPTVPTAWPVGTTVNTAIATGVSAVTGQTTTAQDTATAIVKEISLTCVKTVSLDGGPAAATVEIPATGSHTVAYYVTVTNTGDLPLDVSINDPACALGEPIVIENLAVDATSPATLVCTRTLTCPLGEADLTNTVTVQGQVHQVPGEPVICDVNGLGEPVTATHECSVTITCEELPCVTRTQGYWFNHVSSGAGCATLEAAINKAGGSFNLGFTTVNLDQALGYFWTKGKNSNPVCQARQKAATQLIAAIANQVLLNQTTHCGDAITDLITRAQTALRSCNIAAINAIQSELDAFNNSGDSLSFPAGLRPCSAGKDQKAFIDAHAVAPGAACNACP
jgi:uncharacterized repeat protein (TIGR01451 family)